MVDILPVFQVDVFPLFLGMMVAIIGEIIQKRRLYIYIYHIYMLFIQKNSILFIQIVFSFGQYGQWFPQMGFFADTMALWTDWSDQRNLPTDHWL